MAWLHGRSSLRKSCSSRASRTRARNRLIALLVVAILACVFGMTRRGWAARAGHRDEAYETALRDELRAKAPELVAIWDLANADRDAGQATAARDGYAKIIAAAPTFDHAHRRLCSVEPDQGRAVAACRTALMLQPRWENHFGLAARLANDPATRQEARAEAIAAGRTRPNDASILGLEAHLALTLGDVAGFEANYAALQRVAPDAPETLDMSIFAALVKGDTAGARVALARAKAADALTPEAERNVEAMIARVESVWTPQRVAKTFGTAVLLWLATILALFAIGSLLSKATLKHTDGAAAASTDIGGTRGLKRLYRGVITFAGVVYWISLPFVAALVIGGVLGAIYFCFAVGQIPIKLLLILVLVAASSVWALLKSVVITLRKQNDEDPGEPLALAQHPRLAALLAEVSSRIGTRTADKVFLTPGTQMAVFERGGAIAVARGRGERCLVMGAGVLHGLRVGALKGVLAHEFGHFKNEDTAGGAFSLSVRRSMLQMLVSLIEGRAAGWYNPAWLFATKYHQLFLRISQGASRLQEVLADRWAVTAYGSEPFVDGFEHVIRRTVEHDAHVQHTLDEVTSKNYALANLFSHVPESPPDPDETSRAIREALERDADEYDSHPPPRARIAFARALAVPHAAVSGDDEDAWSLLEDRAALEARLTDIVCENIAREHAIVIRRAA